MAWIEFNNNPVGRKVGDCAVRAISKALNMGWEASYITLAINGMSMGDIMNANSVWGATLRQHNFYRKSLPDTCPACYTVEDFCADNPEGVFVLGTGDHAVTCINGDWYDSFDSGREIPQFVWYRKENDINGI